MGDIRNCPRCGKLFSYFSRPICNACIDAEENEFKLVKEYIYDNKGASMPEVAEATGVSVDKIMRFLRDERLEISSDNENMLLACERCSSPIKSGRFCSKCKSDLESNLKKEFNISSSNKIEREEREKGKDGDKMYTAMRKSRE